MGRLVLGPALLLFAAAAGGALASATACSSFGGAEDPPVDAAVPDGPPGLDADARDAAADDVQVPVDAGADKSFCETSPHDFCADFDTVKNVEDGWGVPFLVGTGKLPIFANPPTAPSRPRVMKSELAGDDDAGSAVNASVLRRADALSGTSRPATKIELDFNVTAASERVDNGPFVLRLFQPSVHIEFHRPNAAATMAIRVYQPEVTPSPPPRIPLVATAKVDEWQHLSVVIGPRLNEATPPTVTITVGTQQAEQFMLEPSPLATQFSCEVGLYTGTPTLGWVVHYDNVTMDWK